VLDVPTVSGRHALLEVVRRPDARGGYSKLVITDLASTNGTRINGCVWAAACLLCRAVCAVHVCAGQPAIQLMCKLPLLSLCVLRQACCWPLLHPGTPLIALPLTLVHPPSMRCA
jgi:hypothetical protein